MLNGFLDGNFEWNFIHLLDLTRTRYEKCNYRSSVRLYIFETFRDKMQWVFFKTNPTIKLTLLILENTFRSKFVVLRKVLMVYWKRYSIQLPSRRRACSQPGISFKGKLEIWVLIFRFKFSGGGSASRLPDERAFARNVEILVVFKTCNDLFICFCQKNSSQNRVWR